MKATDVDTTTVPGAGRARPWRAALRRHRAGIIGSLGLLTLLGAGLAVAAAMPSDCNLAAGSSGVAHCENVLTGRRITTLLSPVLIAGPVVTGILLGAMAFAREFEQRTHVLALSQQQDRRQWWMVSVVTVAGPVVVGWLLLGLGTTWLADSRPGIFARVGMDFPFFDITGAAPALAFLISFALAATVGLLLRTTVLTMVTAGVAAVLVLVGLLLLRPNLVPTERISAPVGQNVGDVLVDRFPPDGSSPWYRGTGMLDSSGAEIEPDFGLPSCTVGRDGLELEALQAFYDECYRAQGIVETYVVVISPDQLNRMRWTMGGIEILLSAAVLGAGVLVLRRRDL